MSIVSRLFYKIPALVDKTLEKVGIFPPPQRKLGSPKQGIHIDHEHLYPNACNGIVCAGAGAGKGTEFIIPNLLGASNYGGSWVVIDPKGQNAYITAKHQRETGREVIILNPWQIYPDRLGEGHSLNPFDMLDKTSADFYDDCKMLARMMVPDTSAKDKHWERRARAFLVMCLAYMIKEEQGSTLKDLQSIVSGISSEVSFSSTKETDEEDSKAVRPSPVDILLAEIYVSEDEELQRMASQFMTSKGGAGEQSKEFSGILSTLYDNLFDLASDRIYGVTDKTTFSLKDLCTGRYAIYLVIPSERLESGSRWLRLVITSLMRSLIRGNGEQRGATYPFTFLLDEFASLGYMKEIETAVQQYRGYNIYSFAILQDLSQLKNLYPQTWQVFINCALLQFYFGINNADTAEFVSKIGGFINVPSPNPESIGTKRERLTIQEAINLSYSYKFIKIRSVQLLLSLPTPYYEDDVLKARAHYPIPPELS